MIINIQFGYILPINDNVYTTCQTVYLTSGAMVEFYAQDTGFSPEMWEPFLWEETFSDILGGNPHRIPGGIGGILPGMAHRIPAGFHLVSNWSHLGC